MTETPRVGDVLRGDSPEPPDGVFLLGPDSKVEKYVSADVGGRWRVYVRAMGPFVVAPDYDFLVYGRRASSTATRSASDTRSRASW